MGAKQSSSGPRLRTYSGSGQPSGSSGTASAGGQPPGSGVGGSEQSTTARARARSLGSFHPATGHSPSLSIPNNNGSAGVGPGINLLGAMSPDSDSSTPDDGPFGRSFTHSLPVHLSFSLSGIKCPVCSKSVAADELECHLVICLTKPRISYNEDVLTEDKGECVICFEDLKQGDTIARLPCLCVYHKMCIDRWFEVNRSCPEHPSDWRKCEYECLRLYIDIHAVMRFGIELILGVKLGDKTLHWMKPPGLPSRTLPIGLSAAIVINTLWVPLEDSHLMDHFFTSGLFMFLFFLHWILKDPAF